MTKKRKKNYYRSYPKKSKHGELTAGMKGFLVSCNNQEYQALQVGYQLLNKYTDLLYPLPDASEPVKNENEDLEESLSREIEEIKKQRHRFNRVETGVRNTIFIKCEDEEIDVTKVMFAILKGIEENDHTKVSPVIKMYPVHATCNAYIDNIKKAFSSLIENLEEETTYYFVLKIKNNDSIKRDEIIVHLGEVVSDTRKKWVPDFLNAHLTIFISVVNKICCISLMRDFGKYRKYNLEEYLSAINKPREEEKSSSNNDDQQTSKADVKPKQTGDDSNRPANIPGPSEIQDTGNSAECKIGA